MSEVERWKSIMIARIPLMKQEDIQELNRAMADIYTAIWHDSCQKERARGERRDEG